MGSGKSSVGRLLAREEDLPMFDTDEMVAAELGMPIPDIFAQLGEERFREMESEVLQKLDGAKVAIIVTGGGIVLRSENVRRLRELGTVVWLRTNLETLRERLSRRQNRPLLQTQNRAETIATLLKERTKFYEEAADFAVDTSGLSHAEVAQAIRNGLQISR